MQLLMQQPLDADAFYSERDSRAGIEHPLATMPSRRIAIVVPPVMACSRYGMELALYWTASIIRRMGRAFAEVILVANHEFRQSPSSLVGYTSLTVEQLVGDELRAADPFAKVEWRSSAETSQLEDAAAVVWLGRPPMAAPHSRTLSINAHGWVATLDERLLPSLTLSPPDFDASPATIAMAACMVAARLFSDSFVKQDRPPHVALAIDAGVGSTDPIECGTLLSSGYGSESAVLWSGYSEIRPSLGKLLVVSAGGIGSNVCRIMKDCFLHFDSAIVLDPDRLEISNLNRAIGCGTANVGAFKAILASEFLKPSANTVVPVLQRYEEWITADLGQQFRKTGTAVVVGVDQVRTRLSVGSDWPMLLLNGSTSGATLSASVHSALEGGCIGCWYGQDDASFLATRTPMACAAGAAPGMVELRPAAGYPFVSVAAAAQLIALLVKAAYNKDHSSGLGGRVTSLSLRSPECVQSRRIQRSNRCLLLCSADYVSPTLQSLGTGS